jgi:hypothetical protein
VVSDRADPRVTRTVGALRQAGQPFLISPTGEYDVALNRYFSVWQASSPWNTQAAHARDLRTYFDFL